MSILKSSNKLERELMKFNESQLKELFENVFAIELTDGCSVGCADCGLGARKGVRDYIPFGVLGEIFSDESFKSGREHMLYFASEPFDYNFDGKSYLDVHDMYKEKVGKNPTTITAIPKGQEELVINVLAGDRKKNISDRVINVASISEFNYNRVKRVFEELDYVKNQKRGRDGAFRFTFPMFDVEFYSKKRPLDFDMFLKSMEWNVWNYYSGKMGRRRIGEKNKDDLEGVGICNINGVILTPLGVYNVYQEPITFKNPTGQVRELVTPENFSVRKYSRNL